MEIALSGKDSGLPRTSMDLLVPPVRVMSAFVWQVAEQCHVLHYDKVAEFVSLVSELVPELLTPSQWAQLILGLRARLVLELCHRDGGCHGEGSSALQNIQNQLDQIHACTVDLSSRNQENSEDVLKTTANFASLVQNLLKGSFEKDYFFQEVFPESYGPTYDKRLQHLVFQFLSRLEQLLPVPNFTQTECWLREGHSVAEEFGQYLSQPSALKTLLFHHRHLGTLSTGPSCDKDDGILSVLSLPLEFKADTFFEQYREDSDLDNEEDNQEERLLTDSEDEEIQHSSDIISDDWSPVKKSGPLSKLFICPLCAFAHRIKKQVQEHIQKKHKKKNLQHSADIVIEGFTKENNRQKTKGSPTKKERKPKNNPAGRTGRKPKDSAPKKTPRVRKDKAENKKERKRKEPTGIDRRFVSSRIVHKDFTEAETKCPHCDKIFDLPNQLKVHLKLHTLAYRCKHCEKGFTSRSGYYQHQRVHKKGRRFVCTHCNSGFLDTYALKQHERIHTEGSNQLCTICGKKFTKAGLGRHMLMHKGERNYLCTTCGKSFFSSGELLLHTRSHTGETPYTCTHCGKGFSCKSHLIVHVRSHTGERPYPCQQCPKRFITVNCLKRHMLCHDDVKPFRCNCGREFRQLGNLKRHQTTHKLDAK